MVRIIIQTGFPENMRTQVNDGKWQTPNFKIGRFKPI